MQIGFIGLGLMGASMAPNLQKAGYELVGHDLNRAAAEPHLGRGAIWADTPRAVAEASEVVFTSLPGPAEVEAVAVGDDGLLEGLRKERGLLRPIDQLADRGAQDSTRRFVARRACTCSTRRSAADPPARAPAGWRCGSAATRRSFYATSRVLDAMGDQARYVGPIGAGSVAKLVHNCAGYAINAALAEVFALGRQRRRRAAWPCGRRCARARSAAAAPSMPWSTSSLPGKYDPPHFRAAPGAQGRLAGNPTRA